MYITRYTTQYMCCFYYFTGLEYARQLRTRIAPVTEFFVYLRICFCLNFVVSVRLSFMSFSGARGLNSCASWSSIWPGTTNTDYL